MDSNNQTKQDAWDRLINSRMGMLANNPSEEYLMEMQKQLHNMLFQITQELHNLYIRRRDELESKKQ